MRKIRILYDYTPVIEAKGRGIGRFTKNLFEALLKYSNDFFEFTLLIHFEQAEGIETYCPGISFIDIDNNLINARFDFLFLTHPFNYLNYIGAYYKYYSNCRKIVSILYDFIPFFYEAEYLSDIRLKKIFYANLNHLTAYDHLFAISQATYHDLNTFIPTKMNNASVIFCNIDHDFTFMDNIEKTNDIIYIAGDDFRKNILTLCRAFVIAKDKKLVPSDTILYIVGSKNDILETANIRSDKIVFLGVISDDELRSRLASCLFSIFPSLYEGFGLPILESYAVGTACIGSNNSAIKELVHADCQFDPTSAEEIALKIGEVMRDEQLIQASLQYGKYILDKMAWPNIVRKVENKLLELNV